MFSPIRNRVGRSIPRQTLNQNLSTKLAQMNAALKRVQHSANDSTPRQVRKNRDLISVPAHNYNLKVRKHFRVVSRVVAGSTATAPLLDLTTRDILALVRNEMDIPEIDTDLGAEFVTIHGGKLYSSLFRAVAANTVGSHGVTLQIFETLLDDQATTEPLQIANFEDSATVSGLCNIDWVEPTRTRPHFDGSDPNVIYLRVYGERNNATDIYNTTLTIDLDIEYVRTRSYGSLLESQELLFKQIEQNTAERFRAWQTKIERKKRSEHLVGLDTSVDPVPADVRDASGETEDIVVTINPLA